MNKINNFYFKLRNSFAFNFPAAYYFCEERKLFFKYAISGTINGSLGLLLLYLFHDILSIEIVVSTTFSFVICLIISFIFQKHWSFRDKDKKKKKVYILQLPFFGINALIALTVNGFLMHVFVNIFSWWYLLSQILINVLIGVYNFFVYKYLIFKKKK